MFSAVYEMFNLMLQFSSLCVTSTLTSLEKSLNNLHGVITNINFLYINAITVVTKHMSPFIGPVF